MAKIGLRYPVFSPLTESGGVVTYGAGIVLGKAISVITSISVADVKLFADNDVAEEDKSFDSGTLSFNSTHIGQEEKALILGHEINGTEVISKDGDEGPYGGFGFYGKEKINGVVKYHAYWLTKVKFREPNETLETKGETTVFQTPTIEGYIYRDITGNWKKDKVFDTETEAVAYLDELANIGEPADKTALLAALNSASELDSEDYTSASWVGVAIAMAEAAYVAALESPSQSRVDAATAELTSAIGDLILRVEE